MNDYLELRWLLPSGVMVLFLPAGFSLFDIDVLCEYLAAFRVASEPREKNQ